MRFTVSCLLSVMFVISFSLHAAKVTQIAQSPELIRPLLPGLEAPKLALNNTRGQDVQLSDLYQHKTTVLVVYRGGWCPYCSRQLASIQTIEQQLVSLGAQIVAVSPDSPSSLMKSTVQSPNYLLLSDSELALSQALGVAYYLDEKTTQLYRDKIGIKFASLDGQNKVALPVPSVFVIDKKGIVQFNYTNPNYKVRLDESVLLAAVTAASNL